MKILFLLPDLFIPPTRGNSYLIYNLLQYVTKHADCDLALLVDRNIDKENAVRTVREHFLSIGKVRIFDKPTGRQRLQARLRFLISGYHQAIGNYWSEPLAKWIQDQTEKRHYGIVHFDMIYMTQYIPYCKNARTVLVPSDAYSLTALNIYRHTSNIRYKARILLEYLIMSNLERRMYHKFDMVCPVAENDSSYLRSKIKSGRFTTVGIGVGKEYVSMPPRSFREDAQSGYGLLYAGPLYVPCVSENIIKFIKQSYPRIKEQVADARLTLLGKGPIPALKKLTISDRNIQHINFVDDYVGFLNHDWVYIHPQHGAAGYKTKIQQIMALGLPVVGSEFAFTGMDVAPGEQCFLCKTDSEFPEYVIRLLLDDTLRNKIGTAAAERVRKRYSIEKVGEEMMDVYKDLLSM